MRVVHCAVEPYTHYIGRPSVFGNYAGIIATRSSRTGTSAERDRSIQAFEAHARHSPDILRAIRLLPADAILGCWCAPLPCHGDIIIKLWQEMHPNSTTPPGPG